MADDAETGEELWRQRLLRPPGSPATGPGATCPTKPLQVGFVDGPQRRPQLESRLPRHVPHPASPEVPAGRIENAHLYWRAIVPILAEQLTGVPYQHTVEAGCEPRGARPGWVTVEYTTPEEEGGNWARRALLGATAGRIWIRWNSTRAPAGHPATDPGITAAQRETIAHEIGRAFGLQHTQRADALMDPDGWFEGDRYLFTPAEEDVARRADRAGRGARYCGDPDECGNGQPSGFRWSDLPDWPVIVVED